MPRIRLVPSAPLVSHQNRGQMTHFDTSYHYILYLQESNTHNLEFLFPIFVNPVFPTGYRKVKIDANP